MSALPPGAELVEVNLTAAVAVDRLESGARLGFTKADAQRVQQPRQLGLVDLAVAIAVDAIEAFTQRVRAHRTRIRRFPGVTNWFLLLVAGSAGAAPPTALPPLQAAWLERLGASEQEIVVTPPVGVTEPRPLVVGVHGAGDRPEWACGGWRLASQVSAFIACPHGSKQGHDRFAWSSSKQLAAAVDAAVSHTQARFGAYVAVGPRIYAGFSQGASLAEPLLLAQASRFPIAILAEGGYATSRSPSFGRAYQAAGGRRVVLVCGSPACFRNAKLARKNLESAGLQVLVVGDEKAGHNLNQRMQQALQIAWPEIAAPLPGRGETEHSH